MHHPVLGELYEIKNYWVNHGPTMGIELKILSEGVFDTAPSQKHLTQAERLWPQRATLDTALQNYLNTHNAGLDFHFPNPTWELMWIDLRDPDPSLIEFAYRETSPDAVYCLWLVQTHDLEPTAYTAKHW